MKPTLRLVQAALIGVACGIVIVAAIAGSAYAATYALRYLDPLEILIYMLCGFVLAWVLMLAWNKGSLSDEEIRRRMHAMKLEANARESLRASLRHSNGRGER